MGAISTIPAWPSSCENFSRVYNNCSKLSNAWTTSLTALMPEDIPDENHAGVVAGTDRELRSKFDISWGGTRQAYFYVNFIQENNLLFDNVYDSEGKIIWKNSQRIENGQSAIPPDISSKASTYSPDLYTSGWSTDFSVVTSDLNVTLSFTRRQHKVTFFDLYNYRKTGKWNLIREDIVNRKNVYSTTYPQGDGGVTPPEMPDMAPDKDGKNYNIYKVYANTGNGSQSPWTTSYENTGATSGDRLDTASTMYFSSVDRDLSAYWHYTIGQTINVTYKYYDGNVYTYSTESVYSGDVANFPTSEVIDRRPGYSFIEWVDIDKKHITTTSPLTSNSQASIAELTAYATYQRKKYRLEFKDGYNGDYIIGKDVDYEGSVDISQITSYSGGRYNSNVCYYGYKFGSQSEGLCSWDGPTSKWTNVSSGANIYSRYRIATVDNSGFFMASYLSSYVVSGHLNEGHMATISLSTDEPETFRLSSASYTDNTFKFNLIKDIEKDDWIKKDKTFNVQLTDELGFEYIIPFIAHFNYNSIKLYFNNETPNEELSKTAWERDKDIVDNDCWGNPVVHMPNPDETKYMGPYLSCSNYGINEKCSKMRAVFSGYDTISFYIKNCGESNKDYPLISKLNMALSAYPSKTDVEVCSSFPEATLTTETDISYYNKVTYDGLDYQSTYFVDIGFVKDVSRASNADRSYLLIDVPEQKFTDEDSRCYMRFDKTSSL